MNTNTKQPTQEDEELRKAFAERFGYMDAQPIEDMVKIATAHSEQKAESWWITTGMKQNGKVLSGPFATQELALSVRTYMEIAEGPATYWVEQLTNNNTEGEEDGR